MKLNSMKKQPVTSFKSLDDPKPAPVTIVQQQHRLSNLEVEARKRDKKSKFKSIKDKLKSRGFNARVDLQDKESVATYLNEEFQLYSQRLIDLSDKQLKALSDAKHLRRRKARQEKSEQRRRGEAVGFEKGNPEFSDSDLPKLTVDKEELKLVREVRSLLNGEAKLSDEEADVGEKVLFTA